MPIGTIATIASLLPNVIQGVTAGIGALQNTRDFNRLKGNQPQYQIPEEYKKNLAMAQQLYAGNMPGYSQTLSEIGQAGARARGGAERGAISSNAYMSSVGDIYQKELDAIQGLGVQQEQYKTQQAQNVMAQQGVMGEQKGQQWNLNKNLPWQTEMNRLGESKAANTQGFFSALQGLGSGVTDLLGTKYLSEAMQGLQPTNNLQNEATTRQEKKDLRWFNRWVNDYAKLKQG